MNITIFPLQFERKTFLFTELKDLITLPDFQRMKNDNHVKDIFNFNDFYYQKHKCFYLLASLSIGSLKSETSNIFWLLDGQHRMYAYSLLYEKYKKDFQISVDLYQKESIEELHDIYDRINKNLPLPIYFPIYSDTILVNQFINKMQKEFGKYIKPSLRPRVPNINVNLLYKAIYNSNILEIFKIFNRDLFQETKNINNYFINLPFYILIEKEADWGIKIKKR